MAMSLNVKSYFISIQWSGIDQKLKWTIHKKWCDYKNETKAEVSRAKFLTARYPKSLHHLQVKNILNLPKWTLLQECKISTTLDKSAHLMGTYSTVPSTIAAE